MAMKSNGAGGLATGSLAAVLVLLASACAHQMGKGAVSGAAQQVVQGQEANADDPNRQIARVLAQRAVEGAVAALDAPEQRARIQQVVNAAVTEAVASALRTATEVPQGKNAGLAGERGVSPVALLMGQAARTAVEDAIRRLIMDLGGHGEGPLAASLAATGKTVSAAVVGSTLDQLSELFPGCRGPGAVACINHQIAAMSQSAAVGFSTGLRESIGWPLLIVAGLIGLLLGLLSHWLWSQRGHGRQVLRTRTT
jgi:hypothetical protein